MPVTLDQFIKEQQDRLEQFRRYWVKNNAKQPDYFPMEMADDDAGLWDEQFQIFDGGE